MSYQIAQANNALIFPGLGLGVTVCRARRVSDPMLAAAAQALADLPEASTPGAPGAAPGHQPARGLGRGGGRRGPGRAGPRDWRGVPLDDPAAQVRRAMWEPAYPTIEPI